MECHQDKFLCIFKCHWRITILLLCVRQPPSNEQKTARRFCSTLGGSAESYKVVYNKKREKEMSYVVLNQWMTVPFLFFFFFIARFLIFVFPCQSSNIHRRIITILLTETAEGNWITIILLTEIANGNWVIHWLLTLRNCRRYCRRRFNITEGKQVMKTKVVIFPSGLNKSSCFAHHDLNNN